MLLRGAVSKYAHRYCGVFLACVLKALKLQCYSELGGFDSATFAIESMDKPFVGLESGLPVSELEALERTATRRRSRLVIALDAVAAMD